MHRRWIVGFCCVVLPLVAQTPTPQREAERYGLGGPVHTVATTVLQHFQPPKQPGGSLILESVSCCLEEYDRDGFRTKVGVSDSGKFSGIRTERTRDEHGQTIEERDFDGSGREIIRRTFRNGPWGKTEQRVYDSGKIAYVTRYGYDDRGHMIELNAWDGFGKQTAHEEYHFDERGHPVEDVIDDGSEYARTLRTFHPEKGYLESYTRLNRDGSVQLKADFSENMLVSYWHHESHEPDDPRLLFVYEDGADRVTREYNWDASYTTTRTRYADKEKRHLKDVVLTSVAGEKLEEARYEYYFDEHGNWTKRTVWLWTPEFHESKKLEQDSRIITYFEK